MAGQIGLVTRALPAAVFVPEETLKRIVRKIALLSDDKRATKEICLIRSGYYKANTDQVILYQHQSTMSPPKADLLKVVNCKVIDIIPDNRLMMGAPQEDVSFINFMKEFWDKSLELDSPITLIICNNLRGRLVDKYVDDFRLHSSLPSKSQE